MIASTEFDFKDYVATRRGLVEERLSGYLDNGEPDILWRSMRYSVLSGGKRLRALLCLAAAEAVTAARIEPQLKTFFPAHEIVLPCACAIEMVHAMSLIHDDLPAMDNDDFRRGRPTNHKVFGEAIALLAGDALLCRANEVLLDGTTSVRQQALLEVAIELQRAVGAQGMVGGQVWDMRSGGGDVEPVRSAELLNIIHSRKTGALITFSLWSGAFLAGAGVEFLSALRRFGQILGLAFQITDDLLDVVGDRESLGKTPGKDQALNKATWVSVHGIDQSRAKLGQLKQEGLEALYATGLGLDRRLALEHLFEYSIKRAN